VFYLLTLCCYFVALSSIQLASITIIVVFSFVLTVILGKTITSFRESLFDPLIVYCLIDIVAECLMEFRTWWFMISAVRILVKVWRIH